MAKKVRLSEPTNLPIEVKSYLNKLIKDINSNIDLLHTSINTLVNAYATTTTVTGSYTLTGDDTFIICNSSSAMNITLPSAVNYNGKQYDIKSIGSGGVTMLTTSGETIDAYASGAITLTTYDNLTVFSNGSNWLIL